ncbi:MAG: hypothetical protein H7333_01870, partial [Bdellovibrionales bacterium]|nr:hypothetical protein [Oligoflexia bacterium]
MINFKSAMSASMVLSLTLGTFSMSAHALPAQSPISLKEAQSMSMVLREIMRLEQKES